MRRWLGCALVVLGFVQPGHGQAQSVSKEDETQKLGPVLARSFNFATQRFAPSPLHAPFEFHVLDSVRANNNDIYDGLSVFRTILSGSENFLAPKDRTLDCGLSRIDCDRFQNASVLRLDLRTHSPVQIGGAVDLTINSFSPGDSISNTFTNHYTGFSRGTDEASRLFRTQVTPQLRRWGGKIESIDLSPVTRSSPLGNVPVTVTRCEGCNLDATAEGGAPIINLTRAQPLGNVVRTLVYAADRRFVEVTVDQDLSAHLSHWTTLQRAVDTREPDAACGDERATHAARWSKTDPFRTDEAGLGGRTALTCFTVGSTEGLSAGTVVVIGSDHPTLETTRVIERVDATHFLANARMPHAGPTPPGSSPMKPGEAVTWGGYAGYAAGFNVDTVAPRGMSDEQRTSRGWTATVCDFDDCNDTPLYLTPFVMASLPGNRLILYVDAEASGTSLNTFGLMANEPVAAAEFAAKIRAGHVSSLATVRTGDYREPLPGDPTLRVNSGQMQLPPPHMHIPGCRVQPAILTSLVYGQRTEVRAPGETPVALGDGLTVVAKLDADARGEGCPDGDAVKVEVERHYRNPLVLYPAALVYRAIKPGERREQLREDRGYQLWMPPAGEFHTGDEVIASTWPLQQVGDVMLYARNVGFNSNRFGAVNTWLFRGQGGEQPMIEVVDGTPPYRFYSDKAHGFAPTADGGGFTSAPSGMSFTGAFSNVFNVLTEPRRDVQGRPGTFVAFRCPPGLTVHSLCEQGVLNPFHLFTVAPELGGPARTDEQSFTIDAVARRWSLTLGGPGAVVHTDAAIEAAGTISGSTLEVRNGDRKAAGIDREGVLSVRGCQGCTLAGETGNLGGKKLEVGECVTSASHVAGAVVGTPVLVSASDGTLPGGAIRLNAAVSAPETVTVELCGVVASTPAARTYRVRVVP